MKELYQKYIDGTCTPEEQAIVIRELKARASSASLWRSFKKQWYKVENVEVDHSIDFESVLNRIHHSLNFMDAPKHKNRFFLPIGFYRYAAIAAAAIVVLMISVGGWYAGSRGLFQKEKFYTVSSVRGQSSRILLADGSQVWLNGESSITYSSRYGSDNRNLQLEGEGYFQVAKNRKIPFVVNSGSLDVTALGTRFNIDAFRKEGTAVITLEEGSVKVTDGEENVCLDPGMQAVVDSKQIKVRRVETRFFTSWRDGKIIFKDEKLINIIAQLEKMYDVDFVINSDSLRDYRYRGIISLDTSILKALKMLQISTGIQYEVNGNQVTLTKQ